MTQDAEQVFQDHQAQLNLKFANRTLDEANILEQHANALTGDDASHSREEICWLAHRLAGGASIFGLGNLSDPAGALETAINTQAPSEDIKNQTLALVELIRIETTPLIAKLSA